MKVCINGGSVSITTDATGYFQKEVVLNRPLAQPGWVDVEYTLYSAEGGGVAEPVEVGNRRLSFAVGSCVWLSGTTGRPETR